MKNYEASNELIDILVKNGFVEDTSKTYPEHARRLVGDNYDPHGMKRHFSFPGTREKVYLDYINIKLPTGVQRYKMTIDEVKSLIAFCLYPLPTGQHWLNNIITCSASLKSSPM